MAQLAHVLLAVCALNAIVVARAPPPIPVAVLIDEPKPEVKANEVVQDEIPRPLVDLENPGPPQRQEHETQNPETYLEQAAKLFSVKENLERTQDLLRQGFQGVSGDIQNWLSNSEQLSLIQQNIQNLRNSFSSQIQKLNETLQGFVELPVSLPAEPSTEETQVKRDFQKIESRLHTLEDNFNNGLNTLSEGIQLVASVKSSESLRQSAPASPEAPSQPVAPAAPANPPSNIFGQYLGILQNNVADGFSNVTQAIGQFITNNPAIIGMQDWLNRTQAATAASSTAPLADTPEGGNQSPPFSLPSFGTTIGNNIFTFFGLNQAQSSGTDQPASGVLQGLPSLPAVWQGLVGNFGNFLGRPGTSAATQPSASGSVAAAAAQPAAGAAAAAGSNSVPEKLTAPEPVAEAQPAAAEPAPATLPPAPVGPIRQILNNIPVVQRIQSQLQATSANSDKPRDAVKSENVEKGGILLIGKPPHNNNSGDNSDIGSGLKPSEPCEDTPKEPSPAEAPAKTD